MTEIEILSKQTEDTYNWTNKLISSIPHDKWDIVPDTVNTNVTWQAGHLILSFYYHSIMVITGHQMDILQKIPMKEYSGYFNKSLPENAVGKFSPGTLLEHLMIIQQKSIDIINSLAPDDLNTDLVSIPGHHSHPVAKNKFEALDWNIKHTMWHCGQLGILKRIVDKRYDFGI